jgi:hypothetical protein
MLHPSFKMQTLPLAISKAVYLMEKGLSKSALTQKNVMRSGNLDIWLNGWLKQVLM